jgi:hypothetical protein
MTDVLYCTIDTSGVREEDKNKAHTEAIRKAIEDEMRWFNTPVHISPDYSP